VVAEDVALDALWRLAVGADRNDRVVCPRRVSNAGGDPIRDARVARSDS
jgi:hypothetical protein